MATILIYITLNRMIYESNQQQQKHETRQLEGNPSFCLLVKKKKKTILLIASAGSSVSPCGNFSYGW